MTERLLLTREVAELLGMSPRWVLDEVKRGHLHGFRVGGGSGQLRFRRAAVDSYLEARATVATPTKEVA